MEAPVYRGKGHPLGAMPPTFTIILGNAQDVWRQTIASSAAAPHHLEKFGVPASLGSRNAQVASKEAFLLFIKSLQYRHCRVSHSSQVQCGASLQRGSSIRLCGTLVASG